MRTENANGKWIVYTDYNSTTKSVENQKFTDFVADFPWDAIVTYETGGSFNSIFHGAYGGNMGAVSTTVQGGTFKGELIASSAPKSGTEITGSFTLNLEPTAGNINLKNAVSARNDAETIALKGGNKMILTTVPWAVTTT